MQFKDVEFMTAKEKEMVLKQWITFIKNGLKEEHFTNRLYEHLIQHCSFIAHFSRPGFYDTYFKNPEDTAHFLTQFDTDKGCESIEYGSTYWVTDGRYADINGAMCKAIDPYKAAIYQRCNSTAIDRDVAAGVFLLKSRGVTPEQYAQLIQR